MGPSDDHGKFLFAFYIIRVEILRQYFVSVFSFSSCSVQQNCEMLAS